MGEDNALETLFGDMMAVLLNLLKDLVLGHIIFQTQCLDEFLCICGVDDPLALV